MPSPRNRPVDLDYLRRTNWWAKVDVGDPTECWEWTRSVGSHGYGQTWDGTSVLLAHRVAWSLGNDAQVPADLTIDHSCHNKVCCNPDHLAPMSNLDNARKNLQGAKTHCPRGHAYDGPNLYVDPRGSRRCRACAKAR